MPQTLHVSLHGRLQVFITDIWVNFHLAYFDNKHRVWVTGKAEIWRHYAKGWLAIDILSTIPYDLAGTVPLNVVDQNHIPAFTLVLVCVVDFIVPSDGGGSPQQLKVLRILKILKLVKLLVSGSGSAELLWHH
jgi:hypothetical protein